MNHELAAPSTPAQAIPPSERLAGFAALLRDHGLTVGVAEQQAMLQAALYFGPLHERPLQAAWRAIACHSQMLPPRLLVSAWQLRAARTLIEAGPFALSGLVLLQLGARLDPANERLRLRWHRLGRLGVVAVLGFLLLVPLQAGLTESYFIPSLLG
jgi:hypothetical protein